MEFSTYLIYFSISVIASVSIGPSVILAANNGINFGYKKALSGVSGHVSAILLLALISASGVGSILLASENTFLIIKYLGVLYLAYIAYAIWHSKGTWSLSMQHNNTPSGFSLYKKSLLLGLSNPKALVFFTALFPQFIQADKALLPQFALLTATSIFNAFIFTFAYAVAGYKLKSKLQPMLNSGLLSKITAMMFLGFATVLATIK